LTKIGNISIGNKFCPKVMGIVNTSPESFYKNSIKIDTKDIQDTVLDMQNSGADLIDIGGMSTAPYLKTMIPIELEIDRLQKAVSAIRQISNIPISIDTVRSNVLKALLKYEINAINDVTGLKFDKKMSVVISESNIPVIIGAYHNSQEDNKDKPFVGDIYDTINVLNESISIAKSHKISDENIIIDPSIGFFRKEGNNPFFSKIEGLDWYIRDLDIISNFALLSSSLYKPVCVSISRKSFIGALLNLKVEERLVPSLIAEIHCITNGSSLIRTHNVRETKTAINMVNLLH
jgi:dihydropteroate synthase